MTGNIAEFITTKLGQLKELKIDVTDLELDHFAYQTSSAANYEEEKALAQETDELIREGVVNGRRVAIFKLKNPLKHTVYSVSAFELIEPKPDQLCDSALDHIEFVLNEPFQNFVSRYPGIEWDLTAINREEFPKVAYKFEDGTSIKFHRGNILKE